MRSLLRVAFRAVITILLSQNYPSQHLHVIRRTVRWEWVVIRNGALATGVAFPDWIDSAVSYEWLAVVHDVVM